MADAKTQLTRDGTMQVTAKEGIGYLQSARADTLLEMQGLKPGDSGAAAGSSSTDKPSMARAGTMAATAKEANALLGSDKPDEDAHTRGQQKKIAEISAEEPAASPAKKPRMPKDTTMVGTAKEGKALLGGEKLGDTRQVTKAKQKKPAPKRETTIAKTMKEAQDLVSAVPEGEGRRTRSQSRGDTKSTPPSVKRAGTMQTTAKEGKDYLKRGRKPKKASKDDEAKDTEEAEEGENSGELAE